MSCTDPGGDPLGLDRASGQIDPAALGVMTVDAFGLGHPPDVVDGVVQGAHLAECGTGAGTGRPVHGADAVLAERPSTVATRGAVAGDLPFQDHHPDRRVQAEQVVRGPQRGVAGAHDGHVDVPVAGQRRAGGERAGHRVVPERHHPVPGVFGGVAGCYIRAGVHGREPMSCQLSKPIPNLSRRASHGPRFPPRWSDR